MTEEPAPAVTEEPVGPVHGDIAPSTKDEMPGSPKEEDVRDGEGNQDPPKSDQVECVEAQARTPILTGPSFKEHSVHSELVSSTRP